jgi:hypothetical protein
MFKFSDILDTLMQSGMSGSTTSRMQNAMRAGGRSSAGFLEWLLGGIYLSIDDRQMGSKSDSQCNSLNFPSL